MCQFVDVSEESGIALEAPGPYGDPSANSGAFAVVDIDGDGWQDLYATRVAGGSHLFINQQDGTFIESVASFGLEGPDGANGAVFADFDNDGDPDLFLTAIDSSQYYLYINQGDGTFFEEAGLRGAAVFVEDLPHRGYSVTVGDYDLDGWLDLHVCDYYGLGQIVDPSTHSTLLRNRGTDAPGHFENVTTAAGMEIVDGQGRQHNFAAAIADFNQDSWPDITVTGDYNTSRFFFNNGDGTFRDATATVGANKDENGMGIAVGDYDGDLDLDFYVTSIFDNPGLPQPEGLTGNRLYRFNATAERFDEVSLSLNLRDGGFGWGTTLFDADNDSDLDLLATNGIFFNDTRVPEQTRYWENDGTGQFSLESDDIGIIDSGEGYGVLAWDYDRDGDLDLIVGQKEDLPILYRNESEGTNNWLRLAFDGIRSNRDGVGTKVIVDPGPGKKQQYFEYNPSNLFLAQSEPFLHIGLGLDSGPIAKIIITWPSGIVQELEDVPVDQVMRLVEPESSEPTAPIIRSHPTRGSFQLGETVVLSVEAVGNPDPVYIWEKNGEPIEGANDPTLEFKRFHPYDQGIYRAKAINSSGTAVSSDAALEVSMTLSNQSVARWWNEFLLEAIRKDFPAPTIHARNLYHLSAAMWDAFWAYAKEGISKAAPIFHDESLNALYAAGEREAAQAEAISFAAYRVLHQRYMNSEGSERSLFGFRWLMEQYGFDPDYAGIEGNSPASIGNRIGFATLAATIDDGSNEVVDYEDPFEYVASNDPLVFELSGVQMLDPNRWQPLAFDYLVTQNGIPIGKSIQTFIGSNWRDVEPFAIEKSGPQAIRLDPGPPPLLGTETENEFIASAVEVIRYSSLLDPAQGEQIDISPGKRLNNLLGSNDGIGRSLNPYTGISYETNTVNHADYGRVLAEFWADGPASETPPGHWNAIRNEVADSPLSTRRYTGQGAELSKLEWDITSYLALNGAMHDAAIAAWTLKRKYDYVRPISIIRYLGGLGQSTLPGDPSYHPQGLPLEPGLIELITSESSAPSQRHEHLVDSIGELALFAWSGQPSDPDTQSGGVDWIRAADWMPYQRSTFVTPAFAAYVSGHSAFSRAGAEVLTLLTGSPFFPGGLGEFHFEQNGYLEFESGPSESLTLQWATYYDAADQAGLSRLYGGIHVSADDTAGRRIGARVGLETFLKVNALRNSDTIPNGIDNVLATITPAPGKATLWKLSSEGPMVGSLPISGAIGDDSNPEERYGIFMEMRKAYNKDASPTYLTQISGQKILSLIGRIPGPRDNSPTAIQFELNKKGAQLVLIRSIGAAKDKGELGDPSVDTRLQLYKLNEDGSRSPLATNDDWQESDTPSITELAAQAMEVPPLAYGSKDPGLVLSLEAGRYEVVAIGEGVRLGEISVEIYVVQ